MYLQFTELFLDGEIRWTDMAIWIATIGLDKVAVNQSCLRSLAPMWDEQAAREAH